MNRFLKIIFLKYKIHKIPINKAIILVMTNDLDFCLGCTLSQIYFK